MTRNDDADTQAEAIRYSKMVPAGMFPSGISPSEWQSNTLTIRERAMLWFMDVITDKPEWARKVDDDTIVAKWEAELRKAVGGQVDKQEGEKHEGDRHEDGQEEQQGDKDGDGRESAHDGSRGGEPDQGRAHHVEQAGEEEDDDWDGHGEDSEQDAEDEGQGDSDEEREDEGDIFRRGFSDTMFNYCIDELRDKAFDFDASAIDGKGGIVPVLDTAAAVFKADGRVPDDVRSALLDVVKALEQQEPDWHPGSDGKVLDLVHPSLWPLVYGTTTQLGTEFGIDDAIAMIGAGEVVPVPKHSEELGLGDVDPWAERNCRVWSNEFQWLPCEISFGDDGKGPARVSSYINNAHPVHHAALYPIIGNLLDISLPMLEAAYDRVMQYTSGGESRSKATLYKRIDCDSASRQCTVPELCDESEYCCRPETMPEDLLREDEDEWDQREEWFEAKHPILQPEPTAYQMPFIEFRTQGPWFAQAIRRPIGPLSIEEGRAQTASEALPHRQPIDRRLQVIVKLANIHLTPDKPSYPGGSWHFEGEANEHIVATLLYYYDLENVTPSRLAFRTVANSERYDDFEGRGYQHQHNDNVPFYTHYVSNRDDSKLQYLGDVETREGRLLAFPNVLQHQVQPFELDDKTRPGHRKILALFLVDPGVRVPSTATVPPQQKHWREGFVLPTRLPTEVQSMVEEHLTVPYDLDKAKELRAKLIEERSALGDEATQTLARASPWNFCEH